MKLKLTFSCVLVLSLCLQQLLGKSYDLHDSLNYERATRKLSQQIVYNRTLNETVRRTRLYYPEISVYKWNQKMKFFTKFYGKYLQSVLKTIKNTASNFTNN